MICYLLKSNWIRNFNFFVSKENFMVCTPKVALIIISIYFFREFFFPATQNLNPKSIRSNKFVFIINTLFIYSQYIFSLNLKTCYIRDKNPSTITSLVYYIILIDYISLKILTRSSPFFFLPLNVYLHTHQIHRVYLVVLKVFSESKETMIVK